MVSDHILIEECRKGSKKAFRELYRKYASVMLGICARYSNNINDAEDILQEGFMKVFNKIGSFRSEGSFEGWIKRIMINTAINHYHKNLKHHHHVDINDIQEKLPDDEDEKIDPELPVSKDIILAIVQNMPEGYKFVFNMFVFEGYSHAEIAKKLGVSVNTSKTQLFKARQYLQKKIQPYVHKNNIQNNING